MIMQSPSPSNSMAIIYKKKSLSAAKCQKCGAKMYPRSLLRPHLNRHQRKELWFATELSKLRNTFSRMRDIA
jgi:ribosomal protein L34E